MGYGFDDLDGAGYEYDFEEIPADFSSDPYGEETEIESILSESEDEYFIENSIDYDEFF